jgi:flagellar biosynthesis protein FliR
MTLDVMHWSLIQFQSFLFILMRVIPILFVMPLFSGTYVPHSMKVGLALVVTLVLLPVVRLDPQRLPTDPYSMAFFMISELMIGLILGLSMKLVFAGLQLAGEFAGFQMGFGMARTVDPQSGSDTAVIAELNYLLGLLIFCSVDGHHWFFKALVQSFHLLSPGELHLGEGIYRHVLTLSGKMFVIGIQMVAPIMAVLIFIQIALGLLAKTVPQINILTTSFPLTVGSGLIFLGLSMDLLWPYLKNLFDESGKGLVMTLLPLMKK